MSLKTFNKTIIDKNIYFRLALARSSNRNRKRSVIKYAYIVAKIALGALFLWAARSKLMESEAFADVIEHYHLLPTQLVNLYALV